MLTKSQIQTPYGKIQTLTVLADGISRFYAEKEMTITEGMALSPERNLQIPACARNEDGLYAGTDRFIADLVFADELFALVGDHWARLQASAQSRLGAENPELLDALMAHKHTFPKPASAAGDDFSPDC